MGPATGMSTGRRVPTKRYYEFPTCNIAPVLDAWSAPRFRATEPARDGVLRKAPLELRSQSGTDRPARKVSVARFRLHLVSHRRLRGALAAREKGERGAANETRGRERSRRSNGSRRAAGQEQLFRRQRSETVAYERSDLRIGQVRRRLSGNRFGVSRQSATPGI